MRNLWIIGMALCLGCFLFSVGGLTALHYAHQHDYEQFVKGAKSTAPEIVCARFEKPSCHVPLGAVAYGGATVWMEKPEEKPPTTFTASPVIDSIYRLNPEGLVSWIDNNGNTVKVFNQSACVQHLNYFQCGDERFPPASEVPQSVNQK